MTKIMIYERPLRGAIHPPPPGKIFGGGGAAQKKIFFKNGKGGGGGKRENLGGGGAIKKKNTTTQCTYAHLCYNHTVTDSTSSHSPSDQTIAA